MDMITMEQLKSAVKENNIHYYKTRNCSICNVELFYIINKDDEVYYKDSCNCSETHLPPQERTWEALLNVFNRQSNPEVRARMWNEFINSGTKIEERKKPTQEEINDVGIKLTKEFVSQGNYIEVGFLSLKSLTIPPYAPDIQVSDMRMAFFAGAQHLMSGMLSILDPEKEPTEKDLQMMDSIAKELDAFKNQLMVRIKKEHPAG